MSFTQDELQALNAIFDQKMAILRRELDRSLDQRMQLLRREFEQRQTAILQDLLRGQTRRLSEQQHRSRDALYQRLELLQGRTAQIVGQEIERQRQQQQMEEVVDRALAAQLLAIEQLINQRLPMPGASLPLAAGEVTPDFDAIEVQTEIPWEDLVELIDNALVERLQQMSGSIQAKLQELERALVVQLHILREQLQQSITAVPLPLPPDEATTRHLTSTQEVFASIEQLERLVESMQVAMTANSALLSNRLYHHQQLPLERAHPRQQNMSMSEPPTPEQGNLSTPDDAEPLPFPGVREGESQSS